MQAWTCLLVGPRTFPGHPAIPSLPSCFALRTRPPRETTMTQRILLQFGLMRNGPGPQRFSAPFQGGTYHVEQQPADGSWTVRYTCSNKELAMNGERVFQSL